MPSVEQVLSQIRKLLATTKVCMSLSYPSGFCDMLAIAVAPRHPSFVGLLLSSFLWKLALSAGCILWCVKELAVSNLQMRHRDPHLLMEGHKAVKDHFRGYKLAILGRRPIS